MIQIKAVTEAPDIAQVAELAKTVWREHYTALIGAEQVDYMLARLQSPEAIAADIAGAYDYFSLGIEGKLFGYLSLRAGDDDVFLSKLYVHSAARGKGLGQAALEHAIDYARQRDVPRLWLTVNKHNRGSIDWYLGRGFVLEEAIVVDIGNGYVMDDYRMALALGE